MKLADRFRVLQTLHGLTREYVQVSVQRGALVVVRPAGALDREGANASRGRGQHP